MYLAVSKHNALVAQLDRVQLCGSWGHRFESYRVRQKTNDFTDLNFFCNQ